MSARLPVPGSDDGDWGDLLNEFLGVSHNSDGTLQTGALEQANAVTSVNGHSPSGGSVTLAASDLGAYARPGGGIPASDLATNVQTAITAAGTAVQLGGDLGGTNTAPIVAKIHGTTINSTAPSDTQVLAYSASQGAWVPSTATAITTVQYTWQGAWATGQSYVVNNCVNESGSGYICLTNHTSGTFATDLASGYWSLFVQSGPQGPTGPQGPQGLTGVNANVLYGTSTTAPTGQADGTIYVTYAP